MREIGKPALWSFTNDCTRADRCDNNTIRYEQAKHVESFYQLARYIAELQFRNKSHILLFRGQSKDFRNDYGLTTIMPSIFRSENYPDDTSTLFKPRFQKLNKADKKLLKLLENHNDFLQNDFYYEIRPAIGISDLRRYRIIRWAILQHYEICSTPLLDVTHSLRVAASFATANNNTNEAFLYVIGVPSINGAITVNAEEGMQSLRLSSACPPSAMRPHIQEGYLVGSYPDMLDFKQKQQYILDEVDLALRLVAKFKFDPQQFWKRESFSQIPYNALYPDEPIDDPFLDVANELKKYLEKSNK